MTAVTAKQGSLAQQLLQNGTDTSIVFQSKESWDSVDNGVVRINLGEQREWVYFTGLSETALTGGFEVTITGCIRGFNKDATTLSDFSSANTFTHGIGAQVVLVFHSYSINQLANTSGSNIFSGNNTWTGTNTFSSTTKATFITQNVTTAQRTALTNLDNGAIVYDIDEGLEYMYLGGAWYPMDTGTGQPDATESIKGVVELATVAEQGSQAATGGSGAGLVLQPKYLVLTSAGAGDESKIAILDSTGKLDQSVMPVSSYKWGGTGADGAISGALTITGSDNTYIEKNYTSFAPGANTVTITPTNCLVRIRISGDCDLTGSTLNFQGKGATGGAGGAAVTTASTVGNIGSVGTAGTAPLIKALNGLAGTGGGGSGTSAGGAVNTQTNVIPTSLESVVFAGRSFPFGAGAGGGGGGSGYMGTGTGGSSGAGGTGGAGGGFLILEVAGNVIFSGTTVNCSGADGSNGGVGVQSASRVGTAAGGGGGGGGGGGTFICMYNGTLTGTNTPNVAGGAAGAGGAGDYQDSASRWGGAGGSGGNSQYTNGTSGAASAITNGTAGGAGGAGQYLIAKNTIFQ